MLLRVLALTAWLTACSPVCADVFDRAASFRRDITREARLVWGINAPLPLFAAQLTQESGFRPNARSRFANGLAQFTPATEKWIKQQYPKSLRHGNAFDPQWSIRAMVRYDQWLYARVKAVNSCHRWAFVLAGYNGGLGWIQRDKRLAKRHGKNPLRWFGHVEKHSPRAKWAFKENRDYPRKIIYRHQKHYRHWGGKLVCIK